VLNLEFKIKKNRISFSPSLPVSVDSCTEFVHSHRPVVFLSRYFHFDLCLDDRGDKLAVGVGSHNHHHRHTELGAEGIGIAGEFAHGRGLCPHPSNGPGDLELLRYSNTSSLDGYYSNFLHRDSDGWRGCSVGVDSSRLHRSFVLTDVLRYLHQNCDDDGAHAHGGGGVCQSQGRAHAQLNSLADVRGGHGGHVCRHAQLNSLADVDGPPRAHDAHAQPNSQADVDDAPHDAHAPGQLNSLADADDGVGPRDAHARLNSLADVGGGGVPPPE